MGEIVVLDEFKMLGFMQDLAKQFDEAWTSAWQHKDDDALKGIDKIVVCAMGGSAISGYLLKDLLSDQKILVEVWSDYELPSWVDDKTLVVGLSYSGGTEETLSAIDKAKELGLKVLIITSGGKLEEVALAQKYSYLKIHYESQPRAAIGWLYGSLLKAVIQAGVVQMPEDEVIKAVKQLSSTIGDKTFFDKAETLAIGLNNKVPIIASYSPLTGVGKRLANQLNENSKALGLSVVFPEACHNFIVGLDNPIDEKLTIIKLESKYSFSRNIARGKIVDALLNKKGIQVIPVSVNSENHLAEQLLLIHFGDLLSLYLAGVYGIDPTPVDIIIKLKEELAKV